MKWLKSGEKYPAHFLVFAELREKFVTNTPFNPFFTTQKLSPCCHPVCHPIVILLPKSVKKTPSLQTTFKSIKTRSDPSFARCSTVIPNTQKACRIGHLQPFHGHNTTSSNLN